MVTDESPGSAVTEVGVEGVSLAGSESPAAMSKRFGDSAPMLERTSRVESLISSSMICAGLDVGQAVNAIAAAPAAWGLAIDVPLIVCLAVDEPSPAPTMDSPGAKRSTQEPKLENQARESDWVEAPTVNADGSRAGETSHAFCASLPAATATMNPSAVSWATALSRVEDALPPRLKLTTPRRVPRSTERIHESPASTPDVEPAPSQSRTRTGTTRASLATPNVAPAAVDATWVPCPWQSAVPLPSFTASKPFVRRPLNSVCGEMPVSTMKTVAPFPRFVVLKRSSSGRLAWSMRSCPQLLGMLV